MVGRFLLCGFFAACSAMIPGCSVEESLLRVGGSPIDGVLLLPENSAADALKVRRYRVCRVVDGAVVGQDVAVWHPTTSDVGVSVQVPVGIIFERVVVPVSVSQKEGVLLVDGRPMNGFMCVDNHSGTGVDITLVSGGTVTNRSAAVSLEGDVRMESFVVNPAAPEGERILAIVKRGRGGTVLAIDFAQVGDHAVLSSWRFSKGVGALSDEVSVMDKYDRSNGGLFGGVPEVALDARKRYTNQQ